VDQHAEEAKGCGMSKRNQDKGRLPPFVPYLKETMQEPAWKAMSLGARMLYLHIKARYNKQSHNNGRLYLSTRTAAKELGGSSLHQVGRWFRELQHYGFIVMTAGSCLGVDGKGRASKWRLTELGYMNDPPTRDYSRWQGDLFVHQTARAKKQNPDVENSIRVMSKTASPVMPKTASLCPPSDVENSIKGNGSSDAENSIKSSLTTGCGWAGSEKDEKVDHTQWTMPTVTEVITADCKPWAVRCRGAEQTVRAVTSGK
jgi:hypothetical protein